MYIKCILSYLRNGQSESTMLSNKEFFFFFFCHDQRELSFHTPVVK